MSKNIFITGDEWLYYKIYCGKRTADLVLTEAIFPLVKELINQKHIDKWFFIRYSNPENHIRLRFHFTDLYNIGFVIQKIKNKLTPYIKEKCIYKIQTDTYVQEIVRYGKKQMPLAESLFFHDSKNILQALGYIDEEDLLILFMLKILDDVLQNFGFNTQEKLAFSQKKMQYYKEEQGINKQTNKQLAQKYRDRKKTIYQFFWYLSSLKEYKSLNKLIKQKKQVDQPLIAEVIKLYNTKNSQDSLNEFIGNLLHMSVNRAFRSKQRVYEMLLYDFLVRFYREVIGRTTDTKQRK